MTCPRLTWPREEAVGWRPVRQELLLGRLKPGEQLPTVKEVVDALAVNPNTVTKAYRELEHEGLVSSRQGLGTFVAASPPPRWRPGRAVGIADPLGAPGPRRGTRGCGDAGVAVRRARRAVRRLG